MHEHLMHANTFFFHVFFSTLNWTQLFFSFFFFSLFSCFSLLKGKRPLLFFFNTQVRALNILRLTSKVN